MRLTDFWQRMERRFGPAYADSVARDQVVPQLGGRTVHEALAAGWETKDIWLAVCEHWEIPARER